MFFWNKKELRSEENGQNEETLEDLILNAGGDEIFVSENIAMELPVISGNIKIISDVIAMVPIKLYKKIKKDGEIKIEEVEEDYRLKLLNKEPNDYMNAQQLKYAVVKDYLLHGNGYIKINKKGNNIEKLIYIPENVVEARWNNNYIDPKYAISINNIVVPIHELMCITQNSKNGINGKGIIDNNKNIIKIMYYTQRNELKTTKTGGIHRGFLQSDRQLTDSAIKKLKDAWLKMTEKVSKGIMILNQGITFNKASMTPAEQQMNESKKTNAEEIRNALNIPDIFNGTYSKDDERKVKRYTLAPILKTIEDEINKLMLLESEKSDYFFAFKMDDLLKADLLERYQAHAIALTQGFRTIDEVRKEENINALGFNQIKLGLGGVYFDVDKKEFFVPNTGQIKGENNIQEGGEE